MDKSLVKVAANDRETEIETIGRNEENAPQNQCLIKKYQIEISPPTYALVLISKQTKKRRVWIGWNYAGKPISYTTPWSIAIRSLKYSTQDSRINVPFLKKKPYRTKIASSMTHLSKNLTGTKRIRGVKCPVPSISKWKTLWNSLSNNYRKHTIIQIKDITDLSIICSINRWALSIVGEY